MEDGFFVPMGNGRYQPTDRVRGPWSSDHMHGGPPSALLAHEMLRAAREAGFTGAALMARITVEILSAVPALEVQVFAEVERPGRRVCLLSAQLVAGAQPVALARAWLIRRANIQLPDADLGESGVDQIPDPGQPGLPDGWGGGYIDSVQWSWVKGSMDQPGPATVWARPRVPLVVDRIMTGEERTLLLADSGSGVSSMLNLREYLFLNTELSVHLFRPPRGDRIWLESATTVDSGGIGLAETRLGDEVGAIGRGAQTLFVTPRSSPS